MENVYNVKLSFKGEGNFTFTLPKYGELTIYAGRDIYIKGLSVAGVEALRQLRPLLLEHQLNAKPDGCYKVIDLETIVAQPRQFQSVNQRPIQSVAEMKKDLIKTTGPIDPNEGKEIVTSTGDVKAEEPSVEAPKAEEPKVEEPKEVKPAPKKTGNKSNTKKKSNKKK